MEQGLDIAVIGGGLAGLSAAWRLGARHRVTLYERHATPGFTAHSVSIEHAGSMFRVDVPLRVFYPGYYPTLLALYEELGVATEPVSYATSFFDEAGEVFFRYRNLRWGERSLAYVLPSDLRGARARRMLAGALRFHHQARAARRDGRLEGLTLADFLRDSRAQPEFVEGLLLPMVATICTCPDEAALRFPAELIVDYLNRGVASQSVRRAVQGADEASQRLSQRVTQLRCRADLRAVVADGQGVSLQHGDGQVTRHQHAVLATSAQQALQLLRAPALAEARLLERVRHHAVDVVVHRDERLMPLRRSDWSAVNAAVWQGSAQAMTTIWVNAVQPSLRHAEPVFQTVAPARAPRDERVIGSARFERPVVDLASQYLEADLARLHAQPGRRIWLCGSYARSGIPLLEAAVSSATLAAQALQDSLAPARQQAAAVALKSA